MSSCGVLPALDSVIRILYIGSAGTGPTNGRAPNPLAWLLCLVTLFSSAPSLTANDEKPVNIAVVSPAASDQYDTVFDDIIRGIKSKIGIELYQTEDARADVLREWLARHGMRHAIALGRRHSILLTHLKWPGKKIVGAAYSTPGQSSVAGISLYLDPLRVARAVRQLNPRISRLVTVVDSPIAPWVVSYRERVREAHSMALEVIEGRSGSTQTARIYWAITQNLKPGTEALWINTDISNTLVDGLVEEAWRRNIPIVSTNLAHIERGFLLALIPDTEKLGKRLAELVIREQQRPIIEPLTDVRRAVNRRVANHLNLTIDPDDFDIVFD